MIRKVCPAVLLSMLFGAAHAKDPKPLSGKDGIGTRAELRYTDGYGVPVVEVGIGGNTYRFIFDTGASITCITDSLALGERLATKRSRYRFKNLQSKLSTTKIPEMRLGDLTLQQQEVVILDARNPIFRVLGIDGIIGGTTLEDFAVTFDSRAKTIVMCDRHDSTEPAQWERFKLWRNLPLLKVGMRDGEGKNHNVTALFDSGNGTGAVVIPDIKDFGKYIQKGLIAGAEEGAGMTSRMIGGLGEPSKLYRGNIERLTMGGGELGGIPVMTGGLAYMLLCWKLTDMGTLTIDYPRKRYAFTPFPDVKAWTAVAYPVMTAVENGKLIVASVWNEQLRRVVSPGDVIEAIGDTEITNPSDTSTPNIDELIEKYDAEDSTVTILDARGVRHILPAELFLP